LKLGALWPEPVRASQPVSMFLALVGRGNHSSPYHCLRFHFPLGAAKAAEAEAAEAELLPAAEVEAEVLPREQAPVPEAGEAEQ
jgi:hypothetical protein